MKSYIILFMIFIILIVIGFQFNKVKENYIPDTQVEIDDININLNDLTNRLNISNDNVSTLDLNTKRSISILTDKIKDNAKDIYITQEGLKNNTYNDEGLQKRQNDFENTTENKFIVIDGTIVNLDDKINKTTDNINTNIKNRFIEMSNVLNMNLNTNIKESTSNLNSSFNTFKSGYDSSLTNINTNLSSLDNLVKSLNVDYDKFKTSTSSINNTNLTKFTNINDTISKINNDLNITSTGLVQLGENLKTAYRKTIENDKIYAMKKDLSIYPTVNDVKAEYTTLSQSSAFISKKDIQLYINEIKASFTSYFKLIDEMNIMINMLKSNLSTINSSYVNKIDLPKLTTDLTSSNNNLITTTIDGLKNTINTINTTLTTLNNNVINNYLKKTDAELSYNTFAKKTDLGSYVSKNDINLYGYALKSDLDKSILSINNEIKKITSTTSSIINTLKVDNVANINKLYVDIDSYDKAFPANWNGVYTKDLYVSRNLGVNNLSGMSNNGLLYGTDINITNVGNFSKGVTTSNNISILGKQQGPFLEKNYLDGFNKYGLSIVNDNLRIYSSCNINLFGGTSNDSVTINKDGTMIINGRFVGNKDSVFNGSVVTQTITNSNNINVLGNLIVNSNIKTNTINANRVDSSSAFFDNLEIKNQFVMNNDINLNNSNVDWFNINNNSKRGLNINNSISLPYGLSVGSSTRTNKGELQINNGTVFNSNNQSINNIQGNTNFNNAVNINKTLRVNATNVTSPSEFNANGGILTNNLYSYGSVQISDDKGNLSRIISKDGIWGVSDKRLKRNIQNIPENELSYINDINPVMFNKLDNNNKHYGFIAQDLEQKYPNLINNKNNYKSVNYEEIIPLLAGNIRQLKKSIPSNDKLCIGNTCLIEKDLLRIQTT